MKKSFTLLFFNLLILGTSIGQNILHELNDIIFENKIEGTPPAVVAPFDCQPDTVLRYQYNALNDSVLINLTRLFYYNETAIVAYNYQPSSNWVTSIDSTVYDEYKRIIFNETKLYDSTNDLIYTADREWYYYFENTNNVDSFIRFDIPFGETQIKPERRINYSRNNDGLLLAVENFNWSNAQQAWAPSQIDEYFYVDSDDLADYIIGSVWDGIEYILFDSLAYEYNSNDDPTTIISYLGEDEILNRKSEYIYDYPQNIEETTISDWNPALEEWEPYANIKIDLNEDGNLEFSEYYFHAFENGSRLEVFYPNNSECRKKEDRSVSEDGINWELDYRNYYSPEAIISKNIEREKIQLNLYPNPTSDGIWIETPPNSFYEIYDMRGILIEKGISDGHQYLTLNMQHSTNLFLKVHKDGAYTSRTIQLIK